MSDTGRGSTGACCEGTGRKTLERGEDGEIGGNWGGGEGREGAVRGWKGEYLVKSDARHAVAAEEVGEYGAGAHGRKLVFITHNEHDAVLGKRIEHPRRELHVEHRRLRTSRGALRSVYLFRSYPDPSSSSPPPPPTQTT